MDEQVGDVPKARPGGEDPLARLCSDTQGLAHCGGHCERGEDFTKGIHPS